MLIKPAYETDAVWDPIRTSQPLGLWWLGSHLKERGHEVRLLDETVRNGGLDNQVMFQRVLDNGKVIDNPLDITYEDFQAQKMKDFNYMSPEEFVNKYSAHNSDGIVRNMVRTGNSEEDTLAEVKRMNPDFVGIPIFASCNYNSAMSLAKAVKESFPETKVVMGGQHVSALPYDVLDKRFVDYVITGDGLSAMTRLVEDKGFLTDMLVGGSKNIKEFPLLDIELIAENKYPVSPNHTFDTEGRKWVDYMFSKGCFRSCDFCASEEKVSTIAFDKIDEQLQRFKDDGIEEIVVQDDAFLFKPKQNLREYLALMKNHGLNWQDNGGIEFEGLTPLVMNMFLDYQNKGDGRITSLYVPLNPREGSKVDSALKDMKARFNRNFSHIKQLRDSGAYVFTSEIIGRPGDTLDLIEENIGLHQDLVQEGYADKSLTFVASTLPGTKWYGEYDGGIVDKEDWASYSIFVPQSTIDGVDDIKDIERMAIKRNQKMNEVQDTYSWGSAFSNV